MAVDDERRMRVDGEEDDPLSSDSSDSENELSDDGAPPSKIEWLATGREKRSTAGNRMKSMIAAEEPDDELELLFAEDADDAGFTDAGDDGSDAQMSSSEDEDAQENADELEGEKELEKQAHESRQAARKRKAQEAIPLKFRKKVKIDTSQTPSASVTPAPKSRPRKKSERISWLPSPADMPTRASKRETTMAGKEQLHKQMAEREVKRLKQIEAMERKAKRMEALKKPPMTQAERLAEAALVEKRNAKSLNRWEEAEKQREEERKAKLAALNNRTLEGPVVTFWSGVGEWVDGKLKHVGKIVTIEEKPIKKKRPSAVGPESLPESSHESNVGQVNPQTTPGKTSASSPGPSPSKEEATAIPDQGNEPNRPNSGGMDHIGKDTPVSPIGAVGQTPENPHEGVVKMTSAMPAPAPQGGNVSGVLDSGEHVPCPPEDASQPQIPPPVDIKPPDLKVPNLQLPSTSLYTTSVFAPPMQPPLVAPPELKPPANSFLAPPAGVSPNGLSMPMIGYHPSPGPTNPSNVLAPPNPTHRQSPLSMPQTKIQPPTGSTPTRPAQAVSTPKTQPKTSTLPPTTQTLAYARPQSKKALSALKTTKVNSQKLQAKELAPPSPPPPPANGKATRNCVIFQNFNENAIKDKSVQTRILFNREMNKLPKQGPAARCVITNHLARYRDPKTGLPYYNAYAFKQIRQLYSGEYKWSSLVGAWVGSGASAATGVPARFVNPDAPGRAKDPKPPDLPINDDTKSKDSRNADASRCPEHASLPDLSSNDDTISEDSNRDTKALMADERPLPVPTSTAPRPSHVGPPVAQSEPDNNIPAAPHASGIELGKGPLMANEPSYSGSQPYVPTTQATFALNTGPLIASDTFTTGSVGAGAVDDINNTQQTDAANASSNIPAVPSAVTGAPALAPPPLSISSSSLGPPVVMEQDTVNQ